jgi:hypothetical protein
VIHTDFEKGFIKAEVISFDDLVALGSVAEAREGQGAPGGQGLRHAGRRRRGVPLQRLTKSAKCCTEPGPTVFRQTVPHRPTILIRRSPSMLVESRMLIDSIGRSRL